eukprot:9155330-Heterocapsa_arctica.AAC.1
MRYFYRVQDRAYSLPYKSALDWIRSRDEAERSVWVDRFRNSEDSLGKVNNDTALTREAMWEVPLTAFPAGTGRPVASPQNGGGNGGGGGGGKVGGGAPGGGGNGGGAGGRGDKG